MYISLYIYIQEGILYIVYSVVFVMPSIIAQISLSLIIHVRVDDSDFYYKPASHGNGK